MSLPRLAARLATVAALRGRTLAGAAVSDSEIPPVDVVARDKPLPFISVYTDDVEASPTGRDLLGADVTFALVIEIGVTAQMKFRLDNGEVVEGEGSPPTDAQIELAIDVIEHQILATLQGSQDAWPELWRRLIAKVKGYKSIRGASSDKGLRFAGRQIVLTVTPLCGLQFPGEPLVGVWGDLLAALEADPVMSGSASWLRAAIAGEQLPSWRVTQAMQGLADGEARALGFMSPAVPSEEPAPLSRVQVEGIGEIDAAAIAEQLPDA